MLTTHSMEEAEALCDRVGIIQGGRLLALDTVAKLRVEHQAQFKITYYPDDSLREGVTLYGDHDQDLVTKVRNLGFQQFVVGRTTLEDVYLGLTSGADGFDDCGG